MPVPHRRQEVGQLPEISVDVDLLQVRLRLPLRVALVLRVRSVDDNFSVASHRFLLDERPTDVVLDELDPVHPPGLVFVVSNGHLDTDIRVAARCERAQTRNAAAAPHGFLEAAADGCDVVEEAKRIEEV